MFEHLNDFNHNLFAFKDISTESTLNTKNEEGETLLRAKTARHLILIFKEIMTNIYKHAKASNVEWSLTAVQKKLTLTIVDDGIGFSLDSPSDGQGMLSINKRVKQLNSTLEISSVEQKGTRIKIEVNI